MTWPPRSPDLASVDCLFWRYIKDAEYIPPLVTTVPQLSGRARTAVVGVALDFLNNAWTETGCKFICRTGPLVVQLKFVIKASSYGDSNASSCNSCAFYFRNTVTVKWYIISRVSVTIDGVWIGESIYWILTHRNYK
jgi:hypothetical protein